MTDSPGTALDELGTLEAALKRKSAALRALLQRLDSRRGRSAITAEEASRLAILQREVDSLERSRDEELLRLSSPDARGRRLVQQQDQKKAAIVSASATQLPPSPPRSMPPPPPPVSTPPRAALGSGAPSSAGGSEAVCASPAATCATGDSRASASTTGAWLAYREAQAMRDIELRGSMRQEWRMRDGEVAALKQRVNKRVDTRISPHVANAQQTRALERAARSVSTTPQSKST